MARSLGIAGLVAGAAMCVWVQVALWSAVSAAPSHGFPFTVPAWLPFAGFLASLTAQAVLLPGVRARLRGRRYLAVGSITVLVLAVGILSGAVVSEFLYEPCSVMSYERRQQILQDPDHPRFEECSSFEL